MSSLNLCVGLVEEGVRNRLQSSETGARKQFERTSLSVHLYVCWMTDRGSTQILKLPLSEVFAYPERSAAGQVSSYGLVNLIC